MQAILAVARRAASSSERISDPSPKYYGISPLGVRQTLPNLSSRCTGTPSYPLNSLELDVLVLDVLF